MMGPPKASNPSLFVANYLYNHHLQLQGSLVTKPNRSFRRICQTANLLAQKSSP
jgi:hypothetical protein